MIWWPYSVIFLSSVVWQVNSGNRILEILLSLNRLIISLKPVKGWSWRHTCTWRELIRFDVSKPATVFYDWIPIFKQAAQLSPRQPRDALYQMKYRPTVVRITQTDCVLTWEVLSATSTLARCTLSSSACPSVRPSDTRQYCTKTAKRRITQTTPCDSPVILAFWRQSSRKIPTGSPRMGAPNRGGIGYNRRFSTHISLYLRNSAR